MRWGVVVAAVILGICSSSALANGAAETYGHDVRSQGKGNAGRNADGRW